MAKENRKVKNSVLVDLFYEGEFAEDNDRMLYNALHKEPLPEGTEIRKIRVDNVLYMNFQNDFSFGVGGKVKLPKPEFYTFYNGKETMEKKRF